MLFLRFALNLNNYITKDLSIFFFENSCNVFFKIQLVLKTNVYKERKNLIFWTKSKILL